MCMYEAQYRPYRCHDYSQTRLVYVYMRLNREHFRWFAVSPLGGAPALVGMNAEISEK